MRGRMGVGMGVGGEVGVEACGEDGEGAWRGRTGKIGVVAWCVKNGCSVGVE